MSSPEQHLARAIFIGDKKDAKEKLYSKKVWKSVRST